MSGIIKRVPALLLMLLLLGGAGYSLAQEDDEKSTLLRYVEEQISSENFQISLNGLEGTLSSDVRMASITISDPDGVWLTIREPRMVWTRTSLLAGELEIESLTAASVDYVRNPLPDESLPDPEASAFSLPELPVSVVLEKLAVERVTFGETVFGLAAEASVDGSVSLVSGGLDLNLSIVRQDGPGGEMQLAANYNKEAGNLNLDLKLSEPENGIVANALNLEGKPPVALSIAGDGPVADLQVDLGFDVDEKRILSGVLNLDGIDQGTHAKARLSGPLATILPQKHRTFFGSTSDLTADVLFEASGAIAVRALNLKSGELGLEASGYRLADGFLQAMNVQLGLAPTSGGRVSLPAGDADMSVANLNMDIRYDAAASERWTAKAVANDYRRGGIRIRQTNLEASGMVSGLNDPATRSSNFETFGLVAGIESDDPGIEDALGEEIKLYANGKWASGQPTDLSAFRVSGDSFNLTSAGKLDGLTYDGNTVLEAKKLEAFSTLANRDLAGSTRLRVAGTYAVLSGGFDLLLEGVAQDLKVAGAMVDPLLNGLTQLSGSIRRNEDGLGFDRLRVSNKQVEASLDGQLASDKANISGDAMIRDVAVLSNEAEGAVVLSLEIAGKKKPFAIKSEIRMDEGNLQRRPVENLVMAFEGASGDRGIKGAFSGNGNLDRRPISLSANLSAQDGTILLQSLIAEITDTTITGDFSRNAAGLMEGNLDIESSDIGDIAALALTDAGGAINGKIDLLHAEGMQTAKADLTVRNVRYQDYRIGNGTLIATAMDLLGKPRIGATLAGKEIRVAGTTVRTLDAKVGTSGNKTEYTLTAALDQHDALLKSNGFVVQEANRNLLSVETLALTSNITDSALKSPAQIEMGPQGARISSAVLKVGSGQVALSGTAGERLDLSIDIAALPVAIINTIVPDIGASGTATGEVRVTGSASDPSATFNLDGKSLSVSQIEDAGIRPLAVSTSGQFQNNRVLLQSLNVSNSQNVALNADGSIPLEGPGMQIRASGSLPLAIANAPLSDRGARVSGTAKFNASVKGSLSNPNGSGSLSISGASFTDPQSNLRLVDIALQAGLSGDQLVINSGQARLSSGGLVRLGGTVGISGKFPANINIRLNGARYTDGETFTTEADGNLTVRGNLLQDPVLAGRIDLSETEITVPESFAGDADLLEVRHLEPDARTRETLDRRERATPTPVPTARPSIMRVDLEINAPNRIFVRGRGLDAEMGGSIIVRGPVSNVQPVGAFELRRGRLAILGKRLDLVEGRITLTGDLDPVIDLTAQTNAQDVTAYVRLQGRVSDVNVTFSSLPELPQDEVLALIIFGRGINDLSPVQIARLAAVADELTGGNSPNLVDGIRSGSGLDDLDVVEDDDGNTAVKAGKYVSDNVYLGVQAGQKNTEATINLDITDNVTARGTVASDGEASIGIFLEKDY